MEKARIALEIQKEKKKLQKIKQREHIYQTIHRHPKIACLNIESHSGIEEVHSNQIFQNLMENMNTSPCGRRYSNATYNFAQKIYQASPKAYEILLSELAFPSVQSLYSHFGALHNQATIDLLSLDNTNNVLNSWKKANNINSQKHIHVTLAVDAISFKPNILVDENGSVTGIRGVTHVDEKQVKNFLNCDIWESFIKNNFSNLITSAFVYQIQPFDDTISNCVVYIQPTTNGKANKEQIDILMNIREISKNSKIVVKVFSFDGDTGYSELHNFYINQWIIKCLDSNHIFECANFHSLRICSDLLHILKRMRYRIVKNYDKIAIGFDSEKKFNYLSLKDLLKHKVPSVVFSNSLFTKMHDSLPLQLFSLETLKILFDNQIWDTIIIFIPWIIIVIAINNPDISSNLTYDLLEISFYYLYNYLYIYMQHHDEISQVLSDRRTKTKSMLMYSPMLIKETLNALHSILMILTTENNVSIRRLGTTPLEHTFGITRMKSKYVQRYDRIIKSITDSHYQNLILNTEENIRGRISNFGKSINFNLDNYEESFSFPNRLIANSLTCYYNSFFQSPEPERIANQFIYELINYFDAPNQKFKPYTLNNILLGTHNSSQIRESICGKTKIKKLLNE